MDYQRWMHILDGDPDCDPSPFWFVAIDGEEVAGLCLCRPRLAADPDMAWVELVGVRPAWRRRGIALALLSHAFAALYHHGQRKAGLEVDAQNPRTLGMTLVSSWVTHQLKGNVDVDGQQGTTFRITFR